ncbi:hypothetical protein ES703_45798 [subsurface metagenome]
MIIPKGTIALDKDKKPLGTLTATIREDPPPPPADNNIVGLVYDFGPNGATFDPPIVFTWDYDPASLEEGAIEEDLVLAYYDESTGEWVELDCVVDTETNTITASVSHFTIFAIIGTVAPPSPPAPVPTPAAFSLLSLRIEPVEIQPGGIVNITVTVTNTGESEGSYAVVLKINGAKEAEKSVTVAAGQSKDVTFSVTKEEADTYGVAVDGLSASFTVIAPAPPPTDEEEIAPPEEVAPPEEEEIVLPAPATNWPMLGGIIAGVIVVVGLFIFFLVRRRAY